MIGIKNIVSNNISSLA